MPFASILATSLALTAVFFVLETVRPAEPRQPIRRWLFNVACLPFLLAWILALQLVFGPVFELLIRATGGGLLPRLFGAPESVPAQVLFAAAFALLWDVWQYWVHRWQHASWFLWQTHRLHHAESALNASAQGRHHATNYVLFLALYAPMIAVFGGLAPHPAAAFVLFRLWGFVNHANVRLDLGAATPVLAGPQWHRIHHSSRPEHRDRNFAAFFPFLDVLFGTYYRPKSGEYPPTGISPEEDANDLSAVTFRPIAAWLGAARGAGGARPAETWR